MPYPNGLESGGALLSTVSLKDALGNYRWVWGSVGRYDSTSDERHEWTSDERSDGSKFVLDSTEPESPASKNLKGRFDMGLLHMSFGGTRMAKGRHHAYIVMKIEKEEGCEEEVRGCLCIMSARDDAGHPFVMFSWRSNLRRGCIIGKRWMSEAEWLELSDGERDRLGIGLTGEKVTEPTEKEEMTSKLEEVQMDGGMKDDAR